MTDRSRTQVETDLVVVTPTYAPDLDLFSDLHDSVLRWFPTEVRHLVVVDDSDVALFRRFEGPRCLVVGVGDVLPRSVRALPLSKLWVNLRRPVPPLRGWIVQQLVKLAVAELVPERVVVMADSDLVFIRPVTVDTFVSGGRVRLYRQDAGIDDSLPRHLRWLASCSGCHHPRHAVARLCELVEHLGSRGREENAAADRGHHRRSVAGRDRKEAPLFRVDALRSLCRRARASKEHRRHFRLALPLLLGHRPPHRRRCRSVALLSWFPRCRIHDRSEVEHTALSVRRAAHAQQYGS